MVWYQNRNRVENGVAAEEKVIDFYFFVPPTNNCKHMFRQRLEKYNYVKLCCVCAISEKCSYVYLFPKIMQTSLKIDNKTTTPSVIL